MNDELRRRLLYVLDDGYTPTEWLHDAVDALFDLHDDLIVEWIEADLSEHEIVNRLAPMVAI